RCPTRLKIVVHQPQSPPVELSRTLTHQMGTLQQMTPYGPKNGTPRQFSPAASTLSTVPQPLNNRTGYFVGAIRHQGQLFHVDSLNLPMNETVRRSLNELFGPNKMYVGLGVQRQGADGNLCELHVSAHMTELMLSESTPSQVAATNFDEGMMREHVFRCLRGY
ncbi:hypothetical protein FOZ60_000290, partial [Perkinsus olseni]